MSAFRLIEAIRPCMMHDESLQEKKIAEVGCGTGY